ncbi:hypothetical protein SUGI_0367430 [Cryptomeria japonica]|nr:hypothetical protein SUGI_0367430 [Cryptomeria japonica]
MEAGRISKERRIEFKEMDFNTGAAEPEIQSTVSNRESPPREDAAIALYNQSGVEQALHTLAQSAIPDIRIEEDALNQLEASQPQHAPSESKRKSIIEVAVALFGASLTLMLAMPGGMDERGRVILGSTISFNLFLVTDMLALVASLAVGMILAFGPPWKVGWLVEIIMWVAAACFLLALLAAGFVVMIPAVKWIVVSFIVAGGMVVAFLIYRAFIFPSQSNMRLPIQMSQQHH